MTYLYFAPIGTNVLGKYLRNMPVICFRQIFKERACVEGTEIILLVSFFFKPYIFFRYSTDDRGFILFTAIHFIKLLKKEIVSQWKSPWFYFRKIFQIKAYLRKMKYRFLCYCIFHFLPTIIISSWLDQIYIFRSSRSEVFCKKKILRKFANFTGKHLCQCLFLIKVATLSKNRLWHRCFPVTFAKFLKKPFILELFQWLLLYFL